MELKVPHTQYTNLSRVEVIVVYHNFNLLSNDFFWRSIMPLRERPTNRSAEKRDGWCVNDETNSASFLHSPEDAKSKADETLVTIHNDNCRGKRERPKVSGNDSSAYVRENDNQIQNDLLN
jgi:hypothetical protein